MNIGELVTLPVRLTVSMTRTALALGQLASPNGPILREEGYAHQLAQVFGPGGLVEQAGLILANERGVVALANTVADLVSPDRPLGQALAPGGVVDRLTQEDGPFMQILAEDGPVARMIVEDGPIPRMLAENGPVMMMLAEDGPVMRLLAEDGPLYRFLAKGGPLDRLLGKEGGVEHLLEPGGLIDQLLEEDGILEKMLQPGGTLDQLVGLALTMRGLIPIMDELREAVETLNATVEPLGRVANRVPIGRRKMISAGRAKVSS